MKAVILARVSTKEQEEGHSIAAQKQRLLDYCQRRNLDVIKSVDIVESSTRGERKEFIALLDYVKEQKETIAIVADAVDRVQRSFRESVMLDELIRQEKIALHFYRENMVIGNDASASDIMRWDFSVMGAKSYVLQLSENVKRSLEYKRKNGEWSGPAPLGYINTMDSVTGKRTLALDHERAILIRRVFEDYASGLYSIQEMTRRAKAWGLRGRKGKPLAPSQIHETLKNPFYYGKMLIKGKLYPHRYDTIITRQLFEECQSLREGRARVDAPRDTKQEFIFRSLITCAVTGRKVTPDIKKGKFIYLITRDPENPDKKLFVPEKEVLRQVEDVFKQLRVPEGLFRQLQKHLQESHESEKAFNALATERLIKEAKKLHDKQQRLLDLFLEQGITKDDYDIKQQQLKQQVFDVERELEAHREGDDDYRVTVSSLFSLAAKAHDIFTSSKNAEKRQLINFMFSNLQLRGKKLEFSLRPPFHLMVNAKSYQEWLPGPDSNQRPIG